MGKTELITSILWKGVFGIFNAKKLRDCEKELLDTFEEYSIIASYRYSNAKICNVPKSDDWYTRVLPAFDETRFKSYLRVSRQQFNKVLDIIKAAEIETETNPFPNCLKWKIEIQLAVSLYRFGHHGTGASYRKVANIFGLSDCGMIRICTDKIIRILVSLENQYIKWPDNEERMQLLSLMEDELPGCLGYVDGSHIPLYEAPIDDHEAYYSRKQQYSMHLQGVCDHNLIFRNVAIGYPGSAHDARVFSNSSIGRHPEKFLRNGQWLAGDSAYRLTDYLVTPFRDNATTGTMRQRRKFNKHFSSHRVKIEQSFGILKMTFTSLQSLRVRVNKKEGHKRACDWILACIVLYNIIRPPLDESLKNIQCDDDDAVVDGAGNAVNKTTRDGLFEWFITNNLE